MNKSLPILGVLTLFCLGQVFAQGIPEENVHPVKFMEIKRHFEAQRAKRPADKPTNPKAIAEGEDYLDGRWLWYWGQHTDANGYIVSPTKTLHEWLSYKEKTSSAKFKTTDQSQWTFTGPSSSDGGYSGIGRINVMAFHPTNSNTFLVGSAGGGVWKTTNNGLTWTALADHLPVLSVSDIDYNPLNPNTLYMCTGDRDSRDHYSIGVLKSYDGGVNWDTTGLKWGISQVRLTNCLVINPLDTNHLILATSEGIYRSFNGGQSFAKVQNGNFKQVLYHPTDTNIVYATSFFTYMNGTDGQIFRSANGGATWTQVTSFTNCWRIQLAVTPGSIGLVKAVAASRDTVYRRGLLGVYTSTDTGKTFQTTFAGHTCTDNILSGDMNGNGCTGQGNYDLALAIHPTNPSRLYIGGVNTWTSANGGLSWQIVNQWWANLPGIAEVHADKHFLGYHPLVPGRLFECNDGGIYFSDNPATLWNDISNGLGITQFYRNAVADISPNVVGGAQDNGSKLFDGTAWEDLTGGDGMDCQLDPTDPDVVYTSTQYGGSIYQLTSTTWPQNLVQFLPGNPVGGWITPFILHPLNPAEMLVGYQDIYQGDNQGNWFNLTNGNLTTKNILRLAMSPDDATTLYAVPEDSTIIWKFSNYSNGISTVITSPYPEKIADIKVDPKNKDHIFITFSGYGTNKVAEYTPAGGWVALNQNLPNVPVNCIEIDSATGFRYIGTDVAVFYRSDTMTQWELYSKNLPAVHVTDLGINYATNEIWAATYGRGMWKSPKATTSTGISIVPYAEDFMQLYPNPAKEAFSIKLPGSYASRPTLCRLVDQTGRVAWQQELVAGSDASIHVSGLPLAKGTYILEVLSDNRLQGKKKMVLY